MKSTDTPCEDWEKLTVGLVKNLLSRLLVEQPRLINAKHYPNIAVTKHWVQTEDEIIWQDDPMLKEKQRACLKLKS